MDNQTSLPLNWTYFYQDNKSTMDELRQSIVLTMELEDTKLKAQEDLKMRDQQIIHLNELLNIAIKERNEAQEKCQKICMEKLILQHQLLQQQQQHSGNISTTEQDDPTRVFDSNNGFSTSDCDESIVSSPPVLEPELPIVVDRPLPEKGKFLEAVMKAGPLLQTLLLAGPLPQWRHPPPPLDTYQIPPPPLLINPSRPGGNDVNKCGNVDRKRGLSEVSHDHVAMELKYQRIVDHQ